MWPFAELARKGLRPCVKTWPAETRYWSGIRVSPGRGRLMLAGTGIRRSSGVPMPDDNGRRGSGSSMFANAVIGMFPMASALR